MKLREEMHEGRNIAEKRKEIGEGSHLFEETFKFMGCIDNRRVGKLRSNLSNKSRGNPS